MDFRNKTSVLSHDADGLLHSHVCCSTMLDGFDNNNTLQPQTLEMRNCASFTCILCKSTITFLRIKLQTELSFSISGLLRLIDCLPGQIH